MPRIEWTRLSGEEAEGVLSIMLYREFPRAVQIRPSQGDGGLDVVVPSEEYPDRIDVWQIKKFASNLGDSEKRQIDKSFVRLLHVIAANEHQVANWHLLMPLNPTRENQTWFDEIGARALKTLTTPPTKKAAKKALSKTAKKAAEKPVNGPATSTANGNDQLRADQIEQGAPSPQIAGAASPQRSSGTVPAAQPGPKVARIDLADTDRTDTDQAGTGLSAEDLERITSWLADERFSRQWRGLQACESLVSDHPNVVDYYLHGGRERVESAVAQVAKLLHGDRSLGDPNGPALQPADLRDHLRAVQAALDGDPHYRFGISLDPQRPPVPLEPGLLAATQETAPDGSTLTFKIFGRFAEATNVRPIPIRLNISVAQDPADAQALELFRLYGKPMTIPAAMSLDLPGGLGGDYEEGTASLGPTADMPDGRFRLRLVDPDGTELATLPVAAGPTSISPNGGGTYRRVIDASGCVEIEVMTRLADGATTLNASFSVRVGGLVAAEALAAVQFIDAWRAGNRLQLAPEHGRFQSFFALGDDVSHDVAPGLLKLLRAIGTIQELADEVLLIPEQLSRQGANEIVNAAKLISGEALLAGWDNVVLDREAAEVHLHQEFDAELRANWEVRVGDQVVFVGVATTHMDAARVEQTEPGLDDRLVPGSVDSAQISLDISAARLPGNLIEILTATGRPLTGGTDVSRPQRSNEQTPATTGNQPSH